MKDLKWVCDYKYI